MKSILIAPSILSADYYKLGEEIINVLKAGGEMIHFDAMDNHFVPNLTIGPLILKCIRKNGIVVPIDVHIMASPVDSLIINFAKFGATFITIHPESTINLGKTLDLILISGCRVGIALNPDTPINVLKPIIDKIDIILVMTVYPGFEGQKFIPNMLRKIHKVRNFIDTYNKKILLEVDGGINQDNIFDVVKAGADILVMGSAIFHTKDYLVTIKKIKDLANNVY